MQQGFSLASGVDEILNWHLFSRIGNFSRLEKGDTKECLNLLKVDETVLGISANLPNKINASNILISLAIKPRKNKSAETCTILRHLIDRRRKCSVYSSSPNKDFEHHLLCDLKERYRSVNRKTKMAHTASNLSGRYLKCCWRSWYFSHWRSQGKIMQRKKTTALTLTQHHKNTDPLWYVERTDSILPMLWQLELRGFWLKTNWVNYR